MRVYWRFRRAGSVFPDIILFYDEVSDAEFDPITWKGIIDGTFFLRLECNEADTKL